MRERAMHLSTFATRQMISCYCGLDATSTADGQLKELIGVYLDEAHAVNPSPDDPAELFEANVAVSSMAKNIPPPSCPKCHKPMKFVLVKTGGRRFRCIECDLPDPLKLPEVQRLLSGALKLPN
jgi:hypothetical protein